MSTSSSGCSSASQQEAFEGTGIGWRLCNESSIGRRESLAEGLKDEGAVFYSPLPNNRTAEHECLGRILLVEDDPKDID